jgi:hypothetical protein
MAIRAAWGLATLLGLASPALAEDCRLALVLALDVSSSVDRTEHQLQRQGLARALVAPEVVRAFFAGDPVAVYVFEWSSSAAQTPILPGWELIDSEEDLARLATALASHPRSGADDPHRSTALGSALSYAADRLQEAPACRARTVDVAGDGASNEGFGPEFAYAHYPFDGVTVNALVVGGAVRSNLLVKASDIQAELVAWFAAHVLHGPGAFWILADGYADYERAMRAKLLRELQAPMVSGMPLAGGGA